jgi:hypothetical protein
LDTFLEDDMRKLALLSLALIAMIAIGCDREITGDAPATEITAVGCFDCHAGQLDQAQGEWANSVHASGSNVDYTNRGGTDCTRCHDQQGFISFLATGTLPDEPFSTVSAIGCFTCHNPHETGTMALRTTAAFTLLDGDVFDHGKANLCVNCHHARTVGTDITDDQYVSSTHWGSHHGPQGDLINGSGGYEFPGMGYTFPNSPHVNQVTDACIGCHMGNVTTHEGYDIGGHSWNMVSLTDEEVTLSGVCSNASCHPTADGLDFLADEDYDGNGTIEGYQTELDGLLEELGTLLTAQGVLSDGSPVKGTIADGDLAGALFNYIIVEEDRSHGVHNFNYIRSLIEASIDYVEGLPVTSPGISTVAMQSAH